MYFIGTFNRKLNVKFTCNLFVRKIHSQFKEIPNCKFIVKKLRSKNIAVKHTVKS